jgi:hypothetical protein
VSAVEGLEVSLAAKFGALFPHLNERQRRLVMGAEARAIGPGGIKLVARAAGVGVVTVSRGVRDLESGEEPLDRVRKPGGGRKRLADLDPGLRPALLALVEPEERACPNLVVAGGRALTVLGLMFRPRSRVVIHFC